MNILQRFVLLFGFILSSSEGSLLLNICLTFGSCHSNDSYLKLTPTVFHSDLYNYTIHIPPDYPFYTSKGLMRIEFYVIMNASNGFDDEKRSVAKSVLYDATGEEVLASSELAYAANEMLRISALLWQPGDRFSMFDNDNQFTTKLVVYQFNNNKIQQSDPYTLIFKRNE